MSAAAEPRFGRHVRAGLSRGRSRPAGAASASGRRVTWSPPRAWPIATIMLLPLLASVLLPRSKSTDGSSSGAADLHPARARARSTATHGSGNFRAGLPTYLMNSGGAALLDRTFTPRLTVPAGYALRASTSPARKCCSCSCCSA